MGNNVRGTSPWGLAAAATVGLGLAGWLDGAHVVLVDWGASGGHRVGWLPPLERLPLAVVVAAFLTAVVWTLAARRRVPGDDRRREALSPLLLFWLWSLPYLPVVADQFPLLLILAGGARWVLAALACGGVVWALWGDGLRARLGAVRPGAVQLFAAALCAYLLVGTYVGREQGFGGDEPHYLILTHSLLADGDLRIENNHEQRDYAPFFRGELAPHFLRRGVGGVIYSIHAPGLPALAVPAYAVGGAKGVRVLISAIAAAGGAAVFLLARSVTGSGPALVTWLAVMFGTPMLFHGWLVFPATPAGALAAWALWWLWSDLPKRAWTWGWRSALLVLWPWLHAKFAVLLACFGLALAMRLLARRSWAALAWLAAPAVLGVALWFYSFYVMYGVADPTIVYGGAGAMTYELQWSNVPRGLLGFALDQEYGVLLPSPAYLLTAPGLWWLVRSRTTRALGLLVIATLGVFAISTARYYMWWGGWSVPGRFLVPVVPLAAVAMAMAVAALRGAMGRGVVAVLVLGTLVTSVVLTARPGQLLMFNDRDGSGSLIRLLQGGVRLDQALPTFLWLDWQAQLPRVLLLTAGLVCATLALWIWRDRINGGMMAPFRAATTWLLAFGLATAIVAGLSASATTLRDSVRDGRLAWIVAAGERRPGVDLTTLTRLRASDVGWLGAISFAAPAEPTDDAVAALGPMTLPPGRYRLIAWFLPNGPGDGDLRLSFHHGKAPVAVVPVKQLNPVTFEMELPGELQAPPLWLGASTLSLARALSRVDLVTLEMAPSRTGRRLRAMAIDPIEGRPGAFMAYLDSGAFDEGGVFWTKGGEAADLLLFPAGAGALRVWVSAGASPGRATVTLAGLTREWQLAPGQREAIELALPARSHGLPLHVAFTGGFRPADVDPASRDRRYLGLRVGVEVP